MMLNVFYILVYLSDVRLLTFYYKSLLALFFKKSVMIVAAAKITITAYITLKLIKNYLSICRPIRLPLNE